MSEKKLIILDSSSLLYRAFFALPPLTNKAGQPTGGVYGFLLTFFKALKDVKATHVAACFDTSKPTFRHEQFVEYKAQRQAAPDMLVPQFGILKEVVKALGIPMFEKEGYEADDLVATIATQAKKEAEVFIVSGDLDNLQLVDDQVWLYTLGKGIKDSVLYDAEKVAERFGVLPKQMNDFKALTGDASDNVPGVPGIGKTTAAQIIKEYGSIENVYAELATDTAVLKPKVKQALKEHKDKAMLSLQLVTTQKDVPVDFALETCAFGGFDQQQAKETFLRLGFASLIERLETLTNYA